MLYYYIAEEEMCK